MLSLKRSKNYLKKRGITSPWKINPPLHRKFNQVVVIPAYGESEYLPHTLSSLNKNDPKLLRDTLVIIVVNHSEGSPYC